MAKQANYDVIIIGSGAAGGMAAKELTERGVRVLVLEAGPKLDPSQWAMNKFAYESMYRGFGPVGWKQNEQWMQDTAGEFSRNFYIKDTEHPYTTDPGKPFMWVRARVVGGKTLHWGRLSWRFSDLDFKAKTHDGFDEDWPISYKDIEPYYDKVEEFVGRDADKQDGFVVLHHLGAGKNAIGCQTCENSDRLSGIADVRRLEDIARDLSVLVGRRCGRRPFDRAELLRGGEDIGGLHVGLVSAEARGRRCTANHQCEQKECNEMSGKAHGHEYNPQNMHEDERPVVNCWYGVVIELDLTRVKQTAC